MKRLLLLEDDRSLGSTLKERLERESFEVSWVETVAKADSLVATEKFDLFVLDVGLPDGNGFEFAKKLRMKSQSPIIFVTAQTDASDRLYGYEIGAEEYIPKPFHLREFLLRVRHVMENHARPKIYKWKDTTIDVEGLLIESPRGREALTKKEANVLALLIQRTPRVVSRDDLLSFAWGQDEFPTNRTVDNVIVRLRQALGEEVGKYIRSVRGVGYRWSEDESDGDA